MSFRDLVKRRINELFVKQLRSCGGFFEEKDQMSIFGAEFVEESCPSAATASKAGASDIVKNKLAMFLRRVYFVRDFHKMIASVLISLMGLLIFYRYSSFFYRDEIERHFFVIHVRFNRPVEYFVIVWIQLLRSTSNLDFF